MTTRVDGGEGSRPSSESLAVTLGMSFLTCRWRGEHSPRGLGWPRARDPWDGRSSRSAGGDEGAGLASAPPAGVAPFRP